jgi:hypothetical protein
MEENLYIYLRNNIEYVTPSYSVAFTRSNADTEIVTLIK